MDQIIGKVPKGVIWEPEPWHVWKTNHNGVIRFVFLLGEAETSVPGGSSACIFLLDDGLQRNNNWCFQTGWRITLVSSTFEFSTDLGSDMIVLHMHRLNGGGAVAKEYFTLSGDQLRFVRMENDKGDAVQNEYVYPNVEIGIVPSGATEEEWIDILQCADKPNVLAALAFLGARQGPMESKYTSLLQKLMINATIRELIAKLSSSENEWIRQAAKLASRRLSEPSLQ